MSTVSLETHLDEVDGVRVLWADLPVDPTMTLWFGVGHKDMTVSTAGITHLVEHLVMRRLGHVAIPHNAESGMVSTQFNGLTAEVRWIKGADVFFRVDGGDLLMCHQRFLQKLEKVKRVIVKRCDLFINLLCDGLPSCLPIF